MTKFRRLQFGSVLGFAVCSLQLAAGSDGLPAGSTLEVRASTRVTESPTLYDGRTLEEWRERIGELDFDDPLVEGDVPGLLAIVEDEQAPWFSRRQAAITLGRIGEPAREAVPLLIGLLDEAGADPEESTQLWAIKALARFGPVAEEAAPTLVAILEDEARDDLPRLASIEGLGRIGPQHPDVLPALIRTIQQALRAGDDPVHSPELDRGIAAVEMLELFGGNGAAAAPVLIQTTRAESVLLRRAAANTLGMIGEAADPAIPALVDLLLFDESAEVRDLAARALGRIGSAAEPGLVQLLSDADVEVRVRAARAFAEFTAVSSDGLEALRTAVEMDEERVSVAALAGIWQGTADAGQVIPGALQHLTSSDREIRMRAVELLESLGPDAEPARSRLEKLAQDERGDVRQAARRVLRSLK